MFYKHDASEHARIFGAPDPLDAPAGPGRTRFCNSCKGWHPLNRPWPHNCRRQAPPRSDLAAPQLAPVFEAFQANRLTGEVIGDRRAKREYMERHDLVEYDEGVTKPDDHWVAQREEEREVAELISTISQTDTESLSARVGFDVTNPERVDAAGSLDEGTDIDTTGIDEA